MGGQANPDRLPDSLCQLAGNRPAGHAATDSGRGGQPWSAGLGRAPSGSARQICWLASSQNQSSSIIIMGAFLSYPTENWWRSESGKIAGQRTPGGPNKSPSPITPG